jgi:glycosyltransferase involved in cell wall biosynthesis
MPRVSVIIPAYNSEATLSEALRSVEAQTYADWEAIVGDDASTDGTATIAEQFDERFRVIRRSENGGAAAARNTAIAVAGGELLAFLDADDYWQPEFLAEQVALYDQSEAVDAGVGIVGSDALILGPEGIAPGTYRDRSPFVEPLTLAGMLEGCPVLTNTMVIPRAAVDRVGGFSTDCLRAQDHDLFIRLLELGYSVAYNDKPLAVYRIHDASVSANAVTMAHYSALVYRRALERGNLGRRERRIATRRLRVHKMAEDLARMREERPTSRLRSLGRYFRMAPRAMALALESPGRSLRLAARARGRDGGISGRVAYHHSSLIAEQGKPSTRATDSESRGD